MKDNLSEGLREGTKRKFIKIKSIKRKFIKQIHKNKILLEHKHIRNLQGTQLMGEDPASL